MKVPSRTITYDLIICEKIKYTSVRFLVDPDPDPHWFCSAGSGSRRAKIIQRNRAMWRIFLFWNVGCSLLRAEGCACSLEVLLRVLGSVADPDPNPDPDPHVFGPSGSTSQRYRSGSGSCSRSRFVSHHAKIVRKTLIPAILWFLTFYLWKMM